MELEIGYVDLFDVQLIPAYDLEVDAAMFAFRTPGILGCPYAQHETVVLVSYHTYRVCLYSPDAIDCRYVFSVAPKTCDRLYKMYLEGEQNV